MKAYECPAKAEVFYDPFGPLEFFPNLYFKVYAFPGEVSSFGPGIFGFADISFISHRHPLDKKKIKGTLFELPKSDLCRKMAAIKSE